MSLWKKILLRSLGFGAGFALMLGALVGVWVWHRNRPEPPKPWNKQAITAEYNYAWTDDDKIFFYYTVQNNTESDYRIDSDIQVELAVRLKREKAFDSSGKAVTVDYPVFIPAKGRVRLKVKTPLTYPAHDKAETSDEIHNHLNEVAQYIATEDTSLDGFVLLDTANKYEIDFPSGWEKKAKESKASK